MNVFYRLAYNTFRELIREHIYFLLLMVGVCMIGLLPTFTLYVFRDQIKLVVDSVMALTLVLGLITAALCASHTISREMRNGTVLLLLSKPVPHWSFAAAKLAGVTAALTLFAVILVSTGFTAVMIARDQFQIDLPVMALYFLLLAICCAASGVCNYLRSTPFTSVASALMACAIPVFSIVVFLVRGVPDDEGFVPPGQFISGMLLMIPAIWIMGAIAAALATRVGIVANLTICVILFLLGLISRYFTTTWMTQAGPEQLFSWLPNPAIPAAANIFRGIFGPLFRVFLPDWQYFWLADALAAHTVIPVSYILWAFLYSILYAGFWFILAVALFHNREVAGDTVS